MKPLSGNRAAGSSLIAQQTLTPPTLGFHQAVDTLEAFNAANVSTPPAQLPGLVAKDKRLQDAAVAFFAYRFTAVSPQSADAGRDLKLAADVAQGVVSLADPAHKKAFLELAFNVSHPAGHQGLAPVIRKALPAADVESALLTHASSSNELHVNNSVEMARWVFSPSYPLSDAGKQQLQQRIDVLSHKQGLNPLLQHAVESFELPD